MSVPHPSQSQLRHCKHQSTHLSLPLPILPVRGPLKAVLLLQKFSPTVAKFVCIVKNIGTLIGKKNGTVGIPNWILWDSGTELFETHKTRMNRIPRSSLIHGSRKMESLALDTLNLVFICCCLHCSSYVYFFICLPTWAVKKALHTCISLQHYTAYLVCGINNMSLRKFSVKRNIWCCFLPSLCANLIMYYEIYTYIYLDPCGFFRVQWTADSLYSSSINSTILRITSKRNDLFYYAEMTDGARPYIFWSHPP
jgi:hypothetical protein